MAASRGARQGVGRGGRTRLALGSLGLGRHARTPCTHAMHARTPCTHARTPCTRASTPCTHARTHRPREEFDDRIGGGEVSCPQLVVAVCVHAQRHVRSAASARGALCPGRPGRGVRSRALVDCKPLLGERRGGQSEGEGGVGGGSHGSGATCSTSDAVETHVLRCDPMPQQHADMPSAAQQPAIWTMLSAPQWCM